MNDQRKGYSRRDVLKLAAAAGAGMVLPTPLLAASGPVLSRPIPRSREMLPVVGLGTAIIFDFDSSSDTAKRAERRTVIRTLLDEGGRLIDTAPSYGRAELTLGDLLPEMGVRDRVFLATKVRATGSRDACTAEMQESLKRLRTNKLDLMQIHNVGFRDRNETTAQLDLLREWKASGVCRYIGVTHSQDQQSANDRLVDLMQRETMNYSIEFATLLIPSMERSIEMRANSHRFAGFRVLKAPDVPSVLVEMGYLSNSHDTKYLKSEKGRREIAAAVAGAVDDYFQRHDSRLSLQ